MERSTLVLIAGEQDAQRLIVSWPAVAHKGSVQGGHRRDWSLVSGVDIEDIERWEPILFTHGFIGPDGYVDPEALLYIEGVLEQPKPRKVMR